MSSLNVKYYITAKTDGAVQFVKARWRKLVFFACFLVPGLEMGVLSSLKPIDPEEALASVNGGLYALITQAAYAGYIFPLLLFTISAIAVMCFVGRFAYSVIITAAFTVALGFFQGATVVLVMRTFGVLALPLVLSQIVISLLIDFAWAALFAMLAEAAAEKRRYGCGVPLLSVLKKAAAIAAICVVLVLLRSLFAVLFSFFL